MKCKWDSCHGSVPDPILLLLRIFCLRPILFPRSYKANKP